MCLKMLQHLTLLIHSYFSDSSNTNTRSPYSTLQYSVIQNTRHPFAQRYHTSRSHEIQGQIIQYCTLQDPLILCYGPRRLRTNPVYSQHSRGGGKGANNVHKFERWLRHGVTTAATIYGPVAFGNQPCVLLRETEDPQGKLKRDWPLSKWSY